MDIRYFFIAGAVTSALSLALLESDYIDTKQPSPIVTPHTVDKNAVELFKPTGITSRTLSALDTQEPQGNSEPRQDRVDDLYKKGKDLLNAIFGFLRSLIMYCVESFFM
ncbi:hypothetical protein [Bartonella sp. CB169]|uniref:hypothetical protein n=1 Tax=Bartonella sp. CB169 TaxID=3112257 RepID=UPI00300E6006